MAWSDAHDAIWGKPKDDLPMLGLATILGLCEAIAKDGALQSVCSDGNSDVQAVARSIALSVLDYIRELKE